MDFLHSEAFATFMQFACQPAWVYGIFVMMMLLSAVGLPLPEEVSILSVGFMVYLGNNPDHVMNYMQARPGETPFTCESALNVHVTALVAFLAVVGSDFLIYIVGRIFGRRLLYHPRVHRFFPENMMKKVEDKMQRYGSLACAIFRFTPGVRFPGHLACGMLKFPAWKFLAIDGVAALVSVPTQIYLVAHYGEEILYFLKEFKIAVITIAAAGLVIFFWYKMFQRWKMRGA